MNPPRSTVSQLVNVRSFSDKVANWQRLAEAQPPRTTVTASANGESTKKRKRESHPHDESVERPTKQIQPPKIGKDGKAKGLIRYTNGQLEWFNPKEGKFEKAVYHHRIRGPLLKHSSNNGANTYDHPRASTSEPNDQTAYHSDQKTWSGMREHWPRIRDDVLNRFRRTIHKPKYDTYEPKYGEEKAHLWRIRNYVGMY